MDQRAPFVRFQIDREAALVAIEGIEEAGRKPARRRVCVAVRRRLDLDDIGAEIGEQQARARPHDRVAELEHAEAGERRAFRARSLSGIAIRVAPAARLHVRAVGLD